MISQRAIFPHFSSPKDASGGRLWQIGGGRGPERAKR
jgi:hypothetical protein